MGADDDVGGRRRSEVRGRRLIAGLLRAAAGPRSPLLLPTRAREALMMACFLPVSSLVIGRLRRALSPEVPAAAIVDFIP
jgi:hypothetical protein